MRQENNNSRRRGVKISFEGVDGSGKTTQTLLIQERLEKMGYCVFRAPDNSDTSGDGLDGRILTILREGRDRFFRIGYPVTENLLLASRAAYLDEVETAPKLESGYVVLADRDIDTFIAYGIPGLCDSYPNKDPSKLMDWMISVVSFGRIWPDLTLFFKPNLEQFLPRATVGVYEAHQKEDFKPEDWTFMKQTVIYYEWLRERFPERIQVFDITDKNTEEVFDKLLHIIIPFLEKRDVPRNKAK